MDINHVILIGRLHVHNRQFRPSRVKKCQYCGRPFDDATYINAHEQPPNDTDFLNMNTGEFSIGGLYRPPHKEKEHNHGSRP